MDTPRGSQREHASTTASNVMSPGGQVAGTSLTLQSLPSMMEELPLLAPTLDPIARQSVISQSAESLASQATEMQTSPELPPRQYNKAVHNHSDNADAVDKSVN